MLSISSVNEVASKKRITAEFGGGGVVVSSESPKHAGIRARKAKRADRRAMLRIRLVYGCAALDGQPWRVGIGLKVDRNAEVGRYATEIVAGSAQ